MFMSPGNLMDVDVPDRILLLLCVMYIVDIHDIIFMIFIHSINQSISIFLMRYVYWPVYVCIATLRQEERRRLLLLCVMYIIDILHPVLKK